MVVLVIEPPVIMITHVVIVPVMIVAVEIFPVTGMRHVPGIPRGPIPVLRPDNIGAGIGVIGGPAVLLAEKVIKDTVQKPVSVVIDPRGVRPHPGLRIRIRGWGWILIYLGMRRHGHDRHRASTQHNGYQ
jgi:hypothetical protein